MIKLSYKELNSESFNQALAQLSQQNGFSNFQAAYNVARIVRQFQKELKTARSLYGNWAEQYMARDEKGQFVKAETPLPYCPWAIIEGKKEEFEKKMDDFLNTQVELQSRNLKPEDLGTVKLSPQQILALEPILDSSFFEESGASQH